MVGENTEISPASKATTSETNLSTASKPRPSSGGKYIEHVYSRKRRQIDLNSNPPHASVLLFSNKQTASPVPVLNSSGSTTTSEHVNSEHASSITTTISTTTIMDTVNASTLAPLHDSVSVAATDENVETFSATTTEQYPENSSISQTNSSDTNPTTITEGDIANTEEDFAITSHDNSQESMTTLEAYKSTTEFNFLIPNNTNGEIASTSDVIKVKTEDVEIPPEITDSIPSNNSKDESISMKPSGGSQAEIQHDYPIYVYGHEDVEIVKLKDDVPVSYDGKRRSSSSDVRDNLSKELTDSNLSIIPNHHNIDHNDLKKLTPNTVHSKVLDELSVNNTTNVSDHHPHPPKKTNVKTIEIPPIIPPRSSPHSKRVLVNVTIATDPGSNDPYATQNVYVLSVSVPTDGDPHQDANVLNAESYMQPAALTRIDDLHSMIKESPPTTKRPYEYWGGECQCNCPCLDDKTDLTEKEEAGDFDNNYSQIQGGLITGKVNNSIIDNNNNSLNEQFSTTNSADEISTTTEDASSWITTETNCPDLTTKLPPPPTILILEGRTAIVF